MKRRLSLIAAALALAIVGTSAVLAYVNRADARAMNGIAAVKAFVAVKPIASGTTLQRAVDEGLAASQTLPKKTVPVGAVTQLATQLRTKVALSDIPAGTLLMTSSFGTEQEPKPILPVPPGKMAVSVALEDSREAELVRPGAEIAIFDTYNTVVNFDAQGRLQPGDRSSVAGDGLTENHLINHATRVLLPRVQVLAVGNDIYNRSDKQTPAAKTSKKLLDSQSNLTNTTVIVTVAVDQNDAERLIQAVQTGHLYLALLTSASKSEPGSGVDDSTLFPNGG